jgi:hypothetical protein
MSLCPFVLFLLLSVLSLTCRTHVSGYLQPPAVHPPSHTCSRHALTPESPRRRSLLPASPSSPLAAPAPHLRPRSISAAETSGSSSPRPTGPDAALEPAGVDLIDVLRDHGDVKMSGGGKVVFGYGGRIGGGRGARMTAGAASPEEDKEGRRSPWRTRRGWPGRRTRDASSGGRAAVWNDRANSRPWAAPSSPDRPPEGSERGRRVC